MDPALSDNTPTNLPSQFRRTRCHARPASTSLLLPTRGMIWTSAKECKQIDWLLLIRLPITEARPAGFFRLALYPQLTSIAIVIVFVAGKRPAEVRTVRIKRRPIGSGYIYGSWNSVAERRSGSGDFDKRKSEMYGLLVIRVRLFRETRRVALAAYTNHLRGTTL